MEAESVTAVLTIVGAFFGTILAALITLMMASIRIQHRDSLATRQLITDTGKENRDLIDQACKENRDLIDQACKENRDLIDQARKENRDLIEKNRDLIERNHGTVISMLGNTRERLAHIEGHLRISRPATDEPESDGDNHEAA